MGGLLARVYVTPKRGILDPQGKAVQHSLHVLGFGEVTDVRVGKYIEVRLDVRNEKEARERVEAMCRQLLANHVIEDYSFDVETDGRASK